MTMGRIITLERLKNHPNIEVTKYNNARIKGWNDTFISAMAKDLGKIDRIWHNRTVDSLRFENIKYAWSDTLIEEFYEG